LLITVFENAGQIGDSFGVVNALFSALAFSLLIYTSLLQTQELKLQREELRENRKQLESSAKAHNELVSLTKVINRDKVIPQLEVIKFTKSKNHIHFYLRVLFGEIHFQEIKISKNYSVVDNNGLSANNDRYLESDIIGPFEILEEKLSKNIQIHYKHLHGSKYYHQVYDITSEWRLSEPVYIHEDNYTMI
jgi:hypothetical protein